MNTSKSAQAGPVALRFLQIVARVGLVVVVTFLLALAFLGLSSHAEDLMKSLLWNWGEPEAGDPQLAVGFVLAAFGVFGLLVWLCRRLAWRSLAIGYIAAAAVLIYMAADDATIRRPLTLEEISPGFPDAEASFNVLMRCGKNHPLAQTVKWPAFKNPYPSFFPDRASEWRNTVMTHRAEFEAHWAELAPVRAWWAELNAFDRIGDLTPARPNAELISFQAFRTLSQHGIAIASLQALDGRGDDAIDTLLPILQVGRKLQPYSRTLVRSMVGVLIERLSIETAAFILDNSAVSPAARARLATALQGGDPEAGARHLISTQYAFDLNEFEGKALGEIYPEFGSGGSSPWVRQTFNVIGPFVYNSRASFNLYGDFSFDLQHLVAHRQIEQLDARVRKFNEQDARPTFKNFFGKMCLHMAVPALSRVAETYWKTQDLRVALLARVTKL